MILVLPWAAKKFLGGEVQLGKKAVSINANYNVFDTFLLENLVKNKKNFEETVCET